MNSELQDTQPSMTVEEVRGSLDLTDNGAIKNSIRNCLTVFRMTPFCKVLSDITFLPSVSTL